MDLSDFIQTLILIGIYIQAILIWRTYRLDHDRRKNQSTIDHITSIREHYRKSRQKIIDYVENGGDLHENISPDIKYEMKEFLSIIEHFSVGVNSDVFSVSMLERMSGNYFLTTFDKFKPYIDFSRSQENGTFFYTEFENMINKIEQIRLKKLKS